LTYFIRFFSIAHTKNRSGATMKYLKYYRLFDDLLRRQDEISAPGGIEATQRKIDEIMRVQVPAKHQLASKLFEMAGKHEAIATDETLSEGQRAASYLQAVATSDQARKIWLSGGELEAESEILHGEIAIANHNPIGARNCFASAVGQTTKNVKALVRNAMMDMLAGRFESAKDIYYTAWDIEPENPRLRTAIGVCLMELGQIEEAKGMLLGVTRHRENRDYAPAYFFLSLIETDPGLRQEYFNGATRNACMIEDVNPYMEPGTGLIIMGHCDYQLPQP
jgi:tetratricopeptide (TPR) repeat protein